MVRRFDGNDLKLFILSVGTGAFSSVAWSMKDKLIIFLCFRYSVVLFNPQRSSRVAQHVVSVESSSLLHHGIKP